MADVIGFSPRQLWLGSANGIASSRCSLEFGMWVEDLDLLDVAQRFLVRVLAQCEELDPDSDGLEPDLVTPEYDDEAMREAMMALADDEEPQ